MCEHCQQNPKKQIIMEDTIVFGPIPSRRLGRSLGINNIPLKYCSYSCMYCQIGKTSQLTSQRQSFYDPVEIIEKVRERISRTNVMEAQIDHIALAPDGEPTLDKNLGKIIELLKSTGIDVAVITNGSLLWQEEVHKELLNADLVSIKIDALSEDTWKRINRPGKELQFDKILQGIKNFARAYQGKLVTETMLIKNVNDSEENIVETAKFIADISPEIAYLSVPTRPTSDKRAEPSDENVINRSFNIFKDNVRKVEYLLGYEGNEYTFTGNARKDILSITAVHPMRKEAVKEFLSNANTNWDLVNSMVKNGELVETSYEGNSFFVRKLP